MFFVIDLTISSNSFKMSNIFLTLLADVYWQIHLHLSTKSTTYIGSGELPWVLVTAQIMNPYDWNADSVEQRQLSSGQWWLGWAGKVCFRRKSPNGRVLVGILTTCRKCPTSREHNESASCMKLLNFCRGEVAEIEHDLNFKFGIFCKTRSSTGEIQQGMQHLEIWGVHVGVVVV